MSRLPTASRLASASASASAHPLASACHLLRRAMATSSLYSHVTSPLGHGRRGQWPLPQPPSALPAPLPPPPPPLLAIAAATTTIESTATYTAAAYTAAAYTAAAASISHLRCRLNDHRRTTSSHAPTLARHAHTTPAERQSRKPWRRRSEPPARHRRAKRAGARLCCRPERRSVAAECLCGGSFRARGRI